MGLCTSCETRSVATAKVILQDGKLQEYSYPVRVSYVLAKDPNTFLCNSEEMEFDDVVTAVHENAELEPGQLYFALPLSKLKRSLSAEEMAALAVKANAALMQSAGGEKCGCRKKDGVGFFGGERKASGKVSDGGVAMVQQAKRNRGGNGNGNGNRRNGRGKTFAANLGTIAE